MSFFFPLFSPLKKMLKSLNEAPFFYRLLLSLLSGIVLSFSQAPTNLWPLIFIGFSLFYYLYTLAQTKRQAFLSAFLFAFGYFVSGLHWIGNALLVEGNEYKWVWPLAVIALPALLALFTALYATINHLLFYKSRLSHFIGFCVFIAFSEWVRGHVFTGFPWNLYGYGWSSVSPIIQSVSLIGSYGLTFLSIFWGGVIGFALIPASLSFPKPAAIKKAIALIAILSFAGAYAFGHWRLSKETNSPLSDVTFHLIQPNIAQAEKWKSDKLVSHFETLVELSSSVTKRSGRNITIWPETALPPSFLKSVAVNERIHSVLNAGDILLSGALSITTDQNSNHPRYHNGLFLWQKDQGKGNQAPRALYSKTHLVPFGEYIPFQKYIPLTPITNFSGFERGSGAQTIQIGNGIPSFSPLICYEIIFPHQAINKHSVRPDFILTLTNDAWYGDSAGPYQHFTQARFRAIEQGLPVIRVANTGISGLIDSYGRVIKQTTLMKKDSITTAIPTKTAQKTYYSMHGNQLFLGFVALCLFTTIRLKQKHFS